MVQIKEQIKCVIFDCDGVLIDSEQLCCKALVEVFSDYNPDITFEECFMHFKGGKVADILSDMIRRYQLHIRMDDVEVRYRQSVAKLFEQELKPIPGIVDALHKLTENGIDYCVVSNSPREKIEHSLDLVGLSELFKGKIFSAFEANSWKPDPDLLLYAAMSMGYSANECLYIDDTDKGVKTGLNAGIETIRFKPSPYIPSDNEQSILQIEHISKLASLIGND